MREAITSCYQTALNEIPLRQQQSIAAYEGGYISLGKLARVMGMTALETRQWLRERDISQHNAFGDEDVANA